MTGTTREVQAAKAEHGKDVGRVGEIGVASDPQYRGNGVDGEDQVGRFDYDQREDESGRNPTAAPADEEHLSVRIRFYTE